MTNYKNETGENQKYRIGGYKSGFNWQTIRPGETKELPWWIAEELGLTEIKEVSEIIEPTEPVETVDSEDIIPVVTEKKMSKEEYKQKLLDIKGVGKKTVEEVLEKYSTVKKLQSAIKKGTEIHNRDDVDAKIKKEFQ